MNTKALQEMIQREIVASKRNATLTFNQVMSKPAEAHDALTTAYLGLISIKTSMDAMGVIPTNLKPFYQQTLKAIDAVTKAQQETYQLRMQMKRISS